MTTIEILVGLVILSQFIVITQVHKIGYIQRVSKRLDIFMTTMNGLVNQGLEDDEKLKIPDPTPNITPDKVKPKEDD